MDALKFLGNTGLTKLTELIKKDLVNIDTRATVTAMAPYLYNITFEKIPEDIPSINGVFGGCTTWLNKNTKEIFRNFDFKYSENVEFVVNTPRFKGIGFVDGIVADDRKTWTKERISQIPNRIVDGLNKDGLFVSTHVAFNDFGFSRYTGDDKVNLANVPTRILASCSTIDDVKRFVTDYVGKFYLDDKTTDAGYVLLFFVTDGTTTLVIQPNNIGRYSYVDISNMNIPKLTNFATTGDETVVRNAANMQLRPTGVERYNSVAITVAPSDLRFTKCYEAQDRLSEFIGIDGTNKNSADAVLRPIQEAAAQEFAKHLRDGKTWFTQHCAIYNISTGLKHLYIQEDFDSDLLTSSIDISNEPVETIPVGTIVALSDDDEHVGFLPCDGQTVYADADYPDLCRKSTVVRVDDTHFKTMDLREIGLVGAGTNTEQTIAAHEPQQIGEFKDDQLQKFTGTFRDYDYVDGPDATGIFRRRVVGGGVTGSDPRTAWYEKDIDLSREARVGDTTHGKQVGVAWYIKATKSYNIQMFIDGADAGPVIEQKVLELNTYSEEERVVGKWVDGRPVYERTYIFKNKTGNFEIELFDMPVDFIVEFTVRKHTSTIDFSLTYDIEPLFIKDNRGLRLILQNQQGGIVATGDVHMIIRYTKRTD